MLKSELMEARLRVLSYDEMLSVAGGDIVVTGHRPSGGGDSWWDRIPGLTYDYTAGIFSGSSYFNYGGGGGSNSTAPEPEPEPELVDTDGDGVPDSPEIVVVAGLNHDQIVIANHWANEQAMIDILLYGALAGVAALDLASLLELGGMGAAEARGAAGAAEAAGAPSVATLLQNLHPLLVDTYFTRMSLAMQAGYDPGIEIDPFSGEPYELKDLGPD